MPRHEFLGCYGQSVPFCIFRLVLIQTKSIDGDCERAQLFSTCVSTIVVFRSGAAFPETPCKGAGCRFQFFNPEK